MCLYHVREPAHLNKPVWSGMKTTLSVGSVFPLSAQEVLHFVQVARTPNNVPKGVFTLLVIWFILMVRGMQRSAGEVSAYLARTLITRFMTVLTEMMKTHTAHYLKMVMTNWTTV